MLQRFDERNRDLIVNINGELVHRDQARISPFDSVVQGGDGVWEGLRLYDGKVFALTQHLDRLRHSALALGFTQIPTHQSLTEELRRTLEANGMRDGVHVRLTLSRGEKITSGMDPRLNQSGPTLIVLAEWKPPVYGSAGITLQTSSVRRFPADAMDPKIHHNNLIQSILAKIEANAAGADDALMLDRQGFIAETNATHVFAVVEGVLTTSTTDACPEGVTRATVLELAAELGIPFAVRNWSQAELYRASEAFCTGTMGELVGVDKVDGRPIGTGDRPVKDRLSKRFSAFVLETGERVVD